MEFKFSTELVSLLYLLLPGFTAAWVFHAFTSHKKASPFERTVQALIFTGFAAALADPVKDSLIWIGTHYWSFRPWTDKSPVFVGMILGLMIGFTASWLANNNWIHWVCARLRITKRTSYASEWYSVFHREASFVYLNFKDGRRLFGWAAQYPDDPKEGHFVLTDVSIPLETGFDPRPLIDRMLIPVDLIEIVEFEKPDPNAVKVGLLRRLWRFLKKTFGKPGEENQNDRGKPQPAEQVRIEGNATGGRADTIRPEHEVVAAADRDGDQACFPATNAPAIAERIVNDGKKDS